MNIITMVTQMREVGGDHVKGEAPRQRPSSCNYCAMKGHWARECHKKQSDIRSGKFSQNNYASTHHENSKSDQVLAMTHAMDNIDHGNSNN